MKKRANIPWEIVESRLAELGKDQQWLRVVLEISPSVMTNWKSRGVPAAKAVPVAVALGMTTDELLGQQGPAAVPGGIRTVVADRSDSGFIHIKKVKLRLSAGVTGFQADPEFDGGQTYALDPRWVLQNGFSSDRLVAIRVKGESMEPSLHENDLVILNTGDTKMVDGAVFAINYEGEAVVKRLSRDAGEWWLTSDNPDQRKYHRKLCRGGECIIIGRVVKKDSDVI